MINVIKYRKIPLITSGLLVLGSIVVLAMFGLKLGIDFTGGSLIEVSFTETRPGTTEVSNALAPLNLGNIVVQPLEDKSMILKMRYVSEEEHQAVLSALRNSFEATSAEEGVVGFGFDSSGNFFEEAEEVTEGETSVVSGNKVYEERIETIGASLSSELRGHAIKAGLIVLLAIILYVAYSFRHVSEPVESWKYGVTAVIALTHDVLITMGVFALLGRFVAVEVDIPFVVALMTILGYSVNDTIVVFDRIRENLMKRGTAHFEETVNMGLNQTFMRSLNTSLTTILVLVVIFFFGGDSVHYFSLALIIGIFFGTYSSIFLASPLLVVWQKLKK
ncbi:MAG: protein translocase subunit SecF [Candidatus Magasanikbacteria bacterium]